MKLSWRILTFMFCSTLVLACLQGGCASQVVQADTQPVAPPEPPAAPLPQQSTQQLEQLVAPIALYPDPLVAQILAGATHPTEIVEADRWLQQNPDLKGESLATAVDTQSWDPSVKALTQFPGLLGMMDKNLSWTSSLGEAYVNGQQNVFDAIQAMRQRAQQAGTLKSTQQESVTTDGNSIVIEPADPQVVYVPEYDPWVVYGDIGTDITWITAIIRMSPIAGSSAISTASPADIPASIITVDPIVAVHITTPAVAAPFTAARMTACIPARSAASVTAATRADFPLAAGRASAGVSMVVEVTAEEVTDENRTRTTVKSIQEA
jgi:hypothetical protein